MSVTVEHVSAVTRKCDACGKEEMRTVLGTDPEFAGVTWEGGWKSFGINNGFGYVNQAQLSDACSLTCYLKIAEKYWKDL